MGAAWHCQLRTQPEEVCAIDLTFLLSIHHSREQNETDSNYSKIFSIWDRIFGTYTATADFDRLRHSLNGFDDREKQTLPALLKLPFINET